MAILDGVLAQHCGWNVFHLMQGIWRAFIAAIMRQQRVTGKASGKSSDDSSLFCLPNEGQELGK